MTDSSSDQADDPIPPSGDSEGQRPPGLLHFGQGGLGDADGMSEERRDLTRRVQGSLAHMFDKPRDRLIAEIAACVADDRHEDAVKVFHTSDNTWFALQAPNVDLLNALLTIDPEKLRDSMRNDLVQLRAEFACKMGQFSKAEPDVRAVLAAGSDMPDFWRLCWLQALAEAARQNGQRGLALHRFQGLAEEMNDAIPAALQAQVFSRIAELLPDHDPDAAMFADRAKDLYLTAGDRLAAAEAQIARAKGLERCDPHSAVAALDEAIVLAEGDALLARDLRARAHKYAANLLAGLRLFQQAHQHATAAVKEFRRLIGRERRLAETLALLAEIERRLGLKQESAQSFDEACAIAKQLDDQWLLTRTEVARAIRSKESPSIEVIQNLARGTSDNDVFWNHFLSAMNGEDLDKVLNHGELAIQMAGYNKTAETNKHLVHWVIGKALAVNGKTDRAIEHLRIANQLSPWAFDLRDYLLNLLWSSKRWGEAVALLRDQVTLVGNMHGLLFALGRSLFEAGDINEAIEVLRRAAGAGDRYAEEIDRLLLQAIKAGGKPVSISEAPRTTVKFPTIDDLRRVLDAFGTNTSANQRMTFWRPGSGSKRHRWRERPEDHGKQLLQAALAAAFGDAIEILEEVRAGAGRIDLYVRLGPLLRVVIEIKICGSGYTQKYAQAGLEQLAHYMQSKKTSVGFLVVFDGRTKEFGQGLEPVQVVARDTFYSVPVDMRPMVKQAR